MFEAQKSASRESEVDRAAAQAGEIDEATRLAAKEAVKAEEAAQTAQAAPPTLAGKAAKKAARRKYEADKKVRTRQERESRQRAREEQERQREESLRAAAEAEREREAQEAARRKALSHEEREQEDLAAARTAQRERRERCNTALSFVASVLIILVYYAGSWAWYSHEEGWSLVDCLYFAVVTCTTIGYGDLTPTSDASMWFTIGFAFVGILVVLLALEEVGSWMQQQHNELHARALRKTLSAIHSAAHRHKAIQHEDHIWKSRLRNIVRASVTGIRRALAQLVLCLVDSYERALAAVVRFDRRLVQRFGAPYDRPRTFVVTVVEIGLPVVAYLWLGAILGALEHWSFVESIYFSSMTLTTIGYGDFSPKTRAGRLFAIFYIPMALGVLFLTLKRLHEYKMRYRTETLSLRKLLEMDENMDGEVSEAEFMRAQLAASGYNKLALEVMREQFVALDADGDGVLTEEDLKILTNVMIRASKKAVASAGDSVAESIVGAAGAGLEGGGTRATRPASHGDAATAAAASNVLASPKRGPKKSGMNAVLGATRSSAHKAAKVIV
eukprot:g2284.t1